MDIWIQTMIPKQYQNSVDYVHDVDQRLRNQPLAMLEISSGIKTKLWKSGYSQEPQQ